MPFRAGPTRSHVLSRVPVVWLNATIRLRPQPPSSPAAMSDNKSRSIPRRHSQVYVDVPLSIHSRPSTSSEQSLKENTPLRPSRTNSQSLMATLGNDGNTSKKRRLLDDDSHAAPEESLSTTTKRARLASAPQTSEKRKVASAKKPKAPTTSPADIPSEEYPHGYFYCHQCNRKRDRSGEYRHRLIPMLWP